MRNTAHQCEDCGAVNSDGLDVLKVRVLAALRDGPMRRSALFRRLGSPPAATLTAACRELIQLEAIVEERAKEVGKGGPTPRLYKITRHGLGRLKRYRSPDGSYVVNT